MKNKKNTSKNNSENKRRERLTAAIIIIRVFRKLTAIDLLHDYELNHLWRIRFVLLPRCLSFASSLSFGSFLRVQNENKNARQEKCNGSCQRWLDDKCENKRNAHRGNKRYKRVTFRGQMKKKRETKWNANDENESTTATRQVRTLHRSQHNSHF